jgi:hypothetical protein
MKNTRALGIFLFDGQAMLILKKHNLIPLCSRKDRVQSDFKADCCCQMLEKIKSFSNVYARIYESINLLALHVNGTASYTQ